MNKKVGIGEDKDIGLWKGMRVDAFIRVEKVEVEVNVVSEE